MIVIALALLVLSLQGFAELFLNPFGRPVDEICVEGKKLSDFSHFLGLEGTDVGKLPQLVSRNFVLDDVIEARGSGPESDLAY